MIIVFEGIDACGKQTQSKRLAQHLNARRIAFPTYDNEAFGETGPLIGAHLKGKWRAMSEAHQNALRMVPITRDDEIGFEIAEPSGPPLDAHVFQCLQTINRYEMAPTIQALVDTGNHVVLDRYWQSAYAFGRTDGLDPVWLIRINALLPQADVNFLLDVDFETSMARRPDRRDRYEKLGEDFYGRVRSNYLGLWGTMRLRDQNSRWIVIDGTKSMDEVTTVVMEELNL